MKRLILYVALAVFFMAGVAYAAGPWGYLALDPNDNTDYYNAYLDDGTIEKVDYPFLYDFAGLDEGAHILKVTSVNVWGERGPVNFSVLKALPPLPIGFGLTNDPNYHQASEGN